MGYYRPPLSGTPRPRRAVARTTYTRPTSSRRRAARRKDRLGFFGVDDIAAAVAFLKGATAIVSSASAIFDPNKSRDEQRKAREQFFEHSALEGSVTAMQYMLGALPEVGSNERPYYEQGIARVRAESTGHGEAVYQAALSRGAKWAKGIPDPGGTQSMIDDVKRDLAAINATVPTAPVNFGGANTNPIPTGTAVFPAPTGTAHQLPGMTTTAPFNYTPWLIGGGVLLLAMRNH